MGKEKQCQPVPQPPAKPPIHGKGDTLHCQQAPDIWAWGHVALPKSHPHMGMGTLCATKKPPIYGHVDTSCCQTDPHIWAWGHVPLPKSLPYMGMGTIGAANKTPIFGCMVHTIQKKTCFCMSPFTMRPGLQATEHGKIKALGACCAKTRPPPRDAVVASVPSVM